MRNFLPYIVTLSCVNPQEEAVFLQKLGFKQVGASESGLRFHGFNMTVELSEKAENVALCIQNSEILQQVFKLRAEGFALSQKQKAYQLKSPEGIDLCLVPTTNNTSARKIKPSLNSELCLRTADINSSLRFWQCLGFKSFYQHNSCFSPEKAPHIMLRSDQGFAISLHQSDKFPKQQLYFAGAEIPAKIKQVIAEQNLQPVLQALPSIHEDGTHGLHAFQSPNGYCYVFSKKYMIGNLLQHLPYYSPSEARGVAVS